MDEDQVENMDLGKTFSSKSYFYKNNKWKHIKMQAMNIVIFYFAIFIFDSNE